MRPGRGAERWVPEIVSRARFRGPGWALPEHAPAQSGPRIRGPSARPMLAPDPRKLLRPCESASRLSRIVPVYPGSFF